MPAKMKSGVGQRWADQLSRRAHRRELLQAFRDCVSDADVQDVYEALVSKAKKGDIEAMKIFFDRTYGPVGRTGSLTTIEDNRHLSLQLNNMSTDALKQMLLTQETVIKEDNE